MRNAWYADVVVVFFLFLWTLNRRIRKWHARSKDAKHDWYSFISVYAHAIAHTSTTYIYTALASRTLWSNVSAYTHGKQHHTQMFVLARLLVRSLACLLKPNDIYLSKNLNFHHSLNHLNTICGYIHDCLASPCLLFLLLLQRWNFGLTDMCYCVSWFLVIRAVWWFQEMFLSVRSLLPYNVHSTHAHSHTLCEPTNHRNCRLFYPFDDERTHVCVPPNADTSRHLKVRSAI